MSLYVVSGDARQNHQRANTLKGSNPVALNLEPRTIRIPLDSRLGIAVMYAAALVLLVIDTLDGPDGLMGRWAIILAVGAVGWTMFRLHAYSRRVILEVMSWEHRVQSFGNDAGKSLALIRDDDDETEAGGV